MRPSGRFRLEAEIDQVLPRLFACETTGGQIIRDYHVGKGTFQRIVEAHSTTEQRRQWHARVIAKNSLKTRFRKGRAPWNKGRRGIHFSPASEFKKGSLHGMAARRWVPIGTISTWHANSKQATTRYIKVRDDGPQHRRWIALARYVWEQAHGPIPQGRVIMHANGDSMDCAPGNVILVDRRQQSFLQFRNDPGLRKRMSARAAEGNRLRAERRREVAAALGIIGVTRFWQCAACSHAPDVSTHPERCVKCGASSFERIAIRRRRKLA